MRCLAAFITLTLAGALAGCKADSVTAPTPVSALWITADVDTITVGDSLPLYATATDGEGRPMSAPSLRWSSSDSMVAGVDAATGRVAARSAGVVMISTNVGATRAYLELTVLGAPVFSSVVAGWVHSCAVAADGRVYCAGWNGYGELGIGVPGDDPILGDRNPFLVRVIGEQRVRSASAYGLHSCALTRSGEVYCWGLGDMGQLGVQNQGYCEADRRRGVVTPCLPAPGKIASSDHFQAIATAIDASCALRTDGRAFCWGINERGELGSSGYYRWGLPIPVDGDFVFATIAGGRNHMCATTLDQRAFCWGSNWRGQLGTDAVPTCVAQGDGCYAFRPYAVLGGHAFAALAPGGFHTCGLTTTQEVYCWGDNSLGQLGDGTAIGSLLPRRVGTGHYTSVVSGDLHSCALDSDGRAWCWGMNDDGQLGAPSADTCYDYEAPYPCSTAPAPAQTAHRFRNLALGMYHSCGVTSAGEVRCWGWNDYGQLGNGSDVGGMASTAMRTAPPSTVARVAAPTMTLDAVGVPTSRHRLRDGPWRDLHPSRRGTGMR